MSPTRRQFVAIAGVSLGLAGCTDGGSPQAANEGDSTQVSLVNTAFEPKRVRIDPGGTVEWINEDDVAHDVTAASFHDAAADWTLEADVGAGERASHTFEAAGIYEYYCTIHGESTMCGVVLAGDASFDGSLPCDSSDGEGGGPGGGYY